MNDGNVDGDSALRSFVSAGRSSWEMDEGWQRLSLSIVVVNYNGEKVLPGTLESIKAIEFPIEKIVFVDDGSSDCSIEVAQRILPTIDIVSMGRNTARPNLLKNIARTTILRFHTKPYIL
jgi:cellulose synthase/poly-beta-1,6-N-acetylglucosamine synthase-like glycosyltransferase